jgi:hypothetical protein
VKILVPIRTHNSANSLTHWRVTSKRRKAVREAVELALRMNRPLPPLPVKVLLTRLGPRFMDLHDGVPNALKTVVDQVAEHYGESDNDPRFKWSYAQEKSKEFGVCIDIEPMV